MRKTVITETRGTVMMNDNHIMTESAAPPVLWHVLRAPFTKRALAELRYSLVTLPLNIAAFVFTLPMLHNGFFWAASTTPLRKFGGAARLLASELLGEDVPPPPPIQPMYVVKVVTDDSRRLAEAVLKAGGKARVWETKPGLTTKKVPQDRVAELAAEAGITVKEIWPGNDFANWIGDRTLDPVAWKARGYFAVRLPLALIALAVIVACWLGGLFCLTFPAWWTLGRYGVFSGLHIASLAGSLAFLPLGAVLLLAGPWLTHGITEADRWLIRGLLGPGSPAQRIRALEESRAHAVEDSAARLRNIERDLHDGTQVQLVALAMKLGLAKEKLQDTAAIDLARITQLIDDAHQGIIEAIADLRTLAHGIHPPVLDSGLADALTTLANRSAVPVELVTDIPERPSDAIETIAYFSAAELLANVAKHSGARRATVEAVHVPGLLRVRVTDDGVGGAHPVANGGLRGLVERVRTVDGTLYIDSPRGGPTTVTVELPSHA